MKHRWALFWTLVSLVLAPEAQAEKRVALVIGNSAYEHAPPLPNPTKDAAGMAALLTTLGFEVIEGRDLDKRKMERAIRDFGVKLAGADVALFYYAGHGLQVAGENYLVAVDAALKREGDLEFEAVKVDQVLRQMQREAKVKVVVLDSCRDNPLAQELTRSMAQTGPAGRSRSTAVASGMGAIDTSGATGTLIAFATAPGSVALDGNGKNSPFTEALLQHIETPGIDIDVMMKRVRGHVTRSTGERQQPWTNSSLTAEFFLNPAKGGTVANAPVPAPLIVASVPGDGGQPRATGSISAGFDPRQMEMALWEEAKKSNSPKDYQAYLEAYPNGTFAGVARNRVASAGRTDTAAAGGALSGEARSAEASEASESKLDLDNKAWREVQRRLSGLGYYNRSVDGEVGAGTRKAVEDWQKARGYTSSGYFNQPQHQALLAEKVPEKKTAARSNDESEEEAKPAPRRTRSATSSSGSGEPRRSNSGGSSAQPSDGSAALMGAIIGGAAGIAIGSRFGRRR